MRARAYRRSRRHRAPITRRTRPSCIPAHRRPRRTATPAIRYTNRRRKCALDIHLILPDRREPFIQLAPARRATPCRIGPLTRREVARSVGLRYALQGVFLGNLGERHRTAV